MDAIKQEVLKFIEEQRAAGKSYRQIANAMDGAITHSTVRNLLKGRYGSQEATLIRLQNWINTRKRK